VRARRRVGLIAFAVAALGGLAGGSALGLFAQGAPRIGPDRAAPPLSRETTATGPQATPSTAPSPRPLIPDTLLAWTPGHLPPGFARGVSRLAGVDHAVAVVSGTAWLTRSLDAQGTVVSRPPPGLGIPIEVAGADLRAYAPFLSPADRAMLPALAEGAGVLGASSASLRGLGAGGTLQLGQVRLGIAGILPDTSIGAHELFVSRATAASLGVSLDRYLLIDPAAGRSPQRLAARIRALLPAGTPIRIRGPGETPYFRQGDAVLPPVRLKEVFGEFAAAPLPNGFLRIDPVWERTHIVTATVPILGTVQCNRALIPQLRGALQEVESEGLSGLIHPADYGGCYSPRFISENRLAGISHHAWGAAIDIGVRANPFGRTPHQDPRLVAIFQRWGFTWGGQWLVPDGMHFEFVRFPAG
jgi:hypothetical protein